jgi:hypothetical protein
MHKPLLILFGSLFYCTTSLAQVTTNRMLFVIDSIPLVNDPEDWNTIGPEDIADIEIIKNKDSLKTFRVGTASWHHLYFYQSIPQQA